MAIWGFMGGYNEQRQANDDHALAQMSLQEGAAKLRQEDLDYKIADTTFQRQQQMWSKMRDMAKQMSTPSTMGQNQGADQIQQSTSTTDRVSAMLNKYAEGLFADGFFEEGTKAIEDIAKLQNSNAEMAIAHANVQKQGIADFQARIAMIDPSDPNAQQEFAQALQQTAKATSLPMPIDPKTPFTQQLKDRIKMVGETARQAAERQKIEAETRKTAVQETVEKERVNLLKHQEKMYDARAEYLRKHAGDTAAGKVPTFTQFQTLLEQRALSDTQVDTTDAAQSNYIKSQTQSLASKARQKFIQSGGTITLDKAVDEVYRDAKAKGAFAGLGSPSWKTQPGTSAKKAEGLPRGWASLDSKKKIESLEDNTWYDINGQSMLWDAGEKKFFTEDQLRSRYMEEGDEDTETSDETSE